MAALLSAAGIWTALVPYVGRALGLGVNVAASVEVIDHVVPGVVVATTAAWLAWEEMRGGGTRMPVSLLGPLACVLAGLWVFMNHLSLLADAAQGAVPWRAAVWHAISSSFILALAVSYLFRVADRGRAR